VLGAWVLALACAPLWAGPIGSEGSLGLSAGYQSNPLLLDNVQGSAESLALLLNLPVTYSGSRVTFSLQPSIRAARNHGSVAPLSDYQYVDMNWDDKGERNDLSAAADWRRDSTFYNQYERSVLGGNTLRRLEEIASLAWRHQLTERADFQLHSSYDRVLYDAGPTQTLSSYGYGQAGAKYNYALSERWQAAIEGGVTRFDLRNQPYRTDATYAQLDLSRDLSERWSMLVSVGSSRLKSTVTVQELVLVPDSHGVLHLVLENFEVVSRQSTANYSLNVQRQFERWKLELSGSRALQPSGFGVLARQDDVSVKASGNWRERLTVSGDIHGSRLYDASGRVSLGSRRYYDCSFYADWRWTEHWTLQSQISLYLQRAAPTEPTRSSTALFLTLSRQFGRKSLN
jgi:hypothetical protein